MNWYIDNTDGFDIVVLPVHIMHYQTFGQRVEMGRFMKVKSGAVMIMGCKTNNAQNGKTYYNVDLYDTETGNLYSCSAQPEVFNRIIPEPKPMQLKSVLLDLGSQYKGSSRIEILDWS